MLPAALRYLVVLCGCCWAALAGQPVAADEQHPLQEALELCESSHREMVRTITDYNSK